MSFSFFKNLRPKTPQELAKAIKDSLMALDTKTIVEVKLLEKVLPFFIIFIIIINYYSNVIIVQCNFDDMMDFLVISN